MNMVLSQLLVGQVSAERGPGTANSRTNYSVLPRQPVDKL